MQRNVELVRTAREVIGNEVDLMADAYMGWTLDYARRMIPLLEPFNLRWLEEPVIPDDIAGYAALRTMGRIPIAGGEHEFTLYGFRQLLDAKAVDYIQFDTNRVGGITQARKVAALAEAYSVPVIPHAGQMHNYHLVMASYNSPMAEFFPRWTSRWATNCFGTSSRESPPLETATLNWMRTALVWEWRSMKKR